MFWARTLRITPELLWFRLPEQKGELAVTEAAVSPFAATAANGMLSSCNEIGYFLEAASEPLTREDAD